MIMLTIMFFSVEVVEALALKNVFGILPAQKGAKGTNYLVVQKNTETI